MRGADLLDSTPRQIYLQRQLGLPQPTYLHLPAVVNALGEKLSKQTRAQPIDEHRPQASLTAALEFLGQAPPDGLAEAGLEDVWHWAIAHWQRQHLPRCRIAPAPAGW